MKKNIFSSKKNESELEGILGSLEREIMETVWDRQTVSGREVFESVKKTKNVALTTVLTVLDRLGKKGLLRKIKDNSVFVYKPVMSRQEFVEQVSSETFKRVMNISSLDAVASFVNVVADSSPEELQRLMQLVEKKKIEMENR